MLVNSVNKQIYKKKFRKHSLRPTICRKWIIMRQNKYQIIKLIGFESHTQTLREDSKWIFVFFFKQNFRRKKQWKLWNLIHLKKIKFS